VGVNGGKTTKPGTEAKDLDEKGRSAGKGQLDGRHREKVQNFGGSARGALTK